MPNIKIGQKVFALFEDGFYYPGIVKNISGDKCSISYLDGYTGEVNKTHVVSLESALKTTSVEGNWQNDGTYFSGVISSYEPLIMNYEDGDVEKVELAQLRFTNEVNYTEKDLQTPQRSKRKRFVGGLVFAILAIIVFIIVIASSTNETPTREISDNENQVVRDIDNDDTATADSVDSGGDSSRDSFRKSLQSVFQYHEDRVFGGRSDAELTGAWAAFNANLWFYSGFERQAYYFAMYGGQSFLREHGSDGYFDEIRALLEDIRTENGFVTEFDFGNVMLFEEQSAPVIISAGSRNAVFRNDADDVISFEPIIFEDGGLIYTLVGALWSTRDGGGNVSVDLDLADHIGVSMAIGFNINMAERRLGNRDRVLRLYFSVEPGLNITSPRDIPSVSLNFTPFDNTDDDAIFIYNSMGREYPTFDAPLFGVLVFGLYSDAEWVDFVLGGQLYRLPIGIMSLAN